jgi:hypothetical protein
MNISDFTHRMSFINVHDLLALYVLISLSSQLLSYYYENPRKLMPFESLLKVPAGIDTPSSIYSIMFGNKII